MTKSKFSKRKKPLAAKIQRARLAAGLTPPELAVKLGIARTYAYYLESGKASPSFFFLEGIAKALNVDMNYFSS